LDLLTDGVSVSVATCVFVPLYEFDTERDGDKVFVVERDIDGDRDILRNTLPLLDSDLDKPICVLLRVIVRDNDCDRCTLRDIDGDKDILRDTLPLLDRDLDRPICVLLLVIVRDNDCDRCTLRDVVTETDTLAITLDETLGVGAMDNVDIVLDPKDIVCELLPCRVTLLERLREFDIVPVRLKARVLLREMLILRDDDGRIPNRVAVLERLRVRLAETLGNLLFEARIDFVGVRLNLNVGVRLGDALTEFVLELDLWMYKILKKKKFVHPFQFQLNRK
jgi:hypothetical protein